MNTKVTASEPGLHLPSDPRSPHLPPPRRPRPDADDPAALDQDRLTTDGPIARYSESEVVSGAQVANAISMSQTQEGFLQVVQRALDRMGELSALLQGANHAPTDREHYTSEFTLLQSFISNIGTKKFNGVALFSEAPLNVNLESDGQKIPLNAIDFNAPSARGGLYAAYDPGSTEFHDGASATAALANIHQALENLDAMQTKVGLNLQRLSLSREQLSVLNENLSAASSPADDLNRIRNLTQLARFKMLGQSGTAMMAQANAFPQTALRLLD